MDARYKIAEAMMRGVGQPMAAFLDQRQDDDMALRGMASDLYQADNRRAQDYRAGIKEAILQSWPAELAKDAWGVIKTPREAYDGKFDPLSDEGIKRAANFAGLMTLGAGGIPAGKNELRMGIKAYHGSPHDFPAERLVRFPDGRTDYIVGKPDVLPIVPPKAEIIQDFPLGRFRMDKIGTGEGAQAYGHGLYAAERETLAKSYRDALTPAVNAQKPGYRSSQDWLDQFSSPIEARKEVDSMIKMIRARGDEQLAKEYELIRHHLDNPYAGRMYEVNLNTTPDRLLDWDKPLSGQPQAVRDGLKSYLDPQYGKGFFDEYASTGTGMRDIYSNFDDLTPQAMSSELSKKGIDGIKYLDAGSRAAGDGSRNYVMFDDKLVQILRKYGVATAAALPAAALAELGMSREEAKRSF